MQNDFPAEVKHSFAADADRVADPVAKQTEASWDQIFTAANSRRTMRTFTLPAASSGCRAR